MLQGFTKLDMEVAEHMFSLQAQGLVLNAKDEQLVQDYQRALGEQYEDQGLPQISYH